MSRRVPLFGIEIDAVTMTEAVDQVFDWTADRDAPCRFVVTPNVDHVVMLHESPALRAAYADASLVLADGWPVVSASRLLGSPLPERVPGSELVPQLCAAANSERGLTVFLLGAMPGVGDRAAANIESNWPDVKVTGVYSPPLGFENNPNENQEILRQIEAANPDLLILGLGAPKQELWIQEHQQRIKARVALCVGATIDFLAGEKKRAPRWIQACRMEWLHRMLSEPKRLAKRYGRDAWIFPQIVWRQMRGT